MKRKSMIGASVVCAMAGAAWGQTDLVANGGFETGAFGPEWTQFGDLGFTGVVTGGAGSDLKLAAAAGVDTFITGEGPHWTYALAEELGLNVLYGGHYATETFGVKALAEHLARKFHVPFTFLDHPTGL